MKNLFTIALLFTLTGCLSSAPKRPTCWLVDTDSLPPLSRAVVDAPYDDTRLTVLRADGSVAFDGFNVFASRPSALIRNSLVADRDAAVLRVRRFALDCRREGQRDALVEVVLTRDGRSAVGSASIPVGEGRFSAAFSKALASAVKEAENSIK